MNKKHNFIISFSIIILSMPLILTGQASFGKDELINDGWLFRLKDEPDAYKADFKDNSWRKLDLPHAWSIEGALSSSLASCKGYLPGGIAWYKKKLEIPAELNGKKGFIYLEGVYNRSTVYLNGQLLGFHPNGYVSFAYDLTPYLKPGESNVLAVRVDHSQSADSRWYTGSGPAHLLGLESANNSDMTSYRDNSHRVYNGKILTYIQSAGNMGEVNVTFSAPWLKSAKVSLTVE